MRVHSEPSICKKLKCFTNEANNPLVNKLNAAKGLILKHFEIGVRIQKHILGSINESKTLVLQRIF
jgi:hypothetical protein